MMAGSVREAALRTTGLRIGLVGPLPPPSGGMANQTLQLATLLQGEGCTVDTIQVNAPYRPSWAGNIRGLRAVVRLAPYLWTLWRSAGRADLLHVMANSGWSWHLFAAPAIWIGALRGCPVVVNYRGGEAGGFLARSARVVRASVRRSAAVAVPSGFLEAVFARHGIATTVVPNIINLERFAPAAANPDAGSAPRLLVARNLEPIYDNAMAIRAFALVHAELPQARLMVAGSGPLRAELEALAASLGVAHAVTFTGRVDNAGMGALYQGADVMLNPSTVDNMPNSVLEALASGVPVVSTNVGGVPYMVEDGRTALLVPAGDAAAMAGAVLRLCREAGLAASLREAGLSYVQQYAWAGVRPRLMALYHSVLPTSPAKIATTP